MSQDIERRPAEKVARFRAEGGARIAVLAE